jgi:hypothetical protein
MSGSLKYARLAVVLALCLLVPACKSKASKANYDKIKEGMTLGDVEQVLGKGTKDEGGDGSNVAGQFGVAIQPVATAGAGGAETWIWEGGGNTIRVIFREGKVVAKSGY